jgi:uncharacterized protein YcfJ
LCSIRSRGKKSIVYKQWCIHTVGRMIGHVVGHMVGYLVGHLVGHLVGRMVGHAVGHKCGWAVICKWMR